MLCRALAKECGARMLQIAPSDVMDMYVGEAEKLVRAVFVSTVPNSASTRADWCICSSLGSHSRDVSVLA